MDWRGRSGGLLLIYATLNYNTKRIDLQDHKNENLMKKTLLIAFLTFASICGFSQTRKDFFNFASAFDWSMSETDFKARYGSRIVPETDSLVLSMDIQKGTYLLNDLKIGDYDCLTLVSYGMDETPSIVARLTDEALQASMPTVLTMKLNRIVEQKMQEPDLKLDDMPLSSFGFAGMEDVKGTLRFWMTDVLIFGTVSTTTEDGLTYLFVARKGEPREPDFRKGKWGDSVAACKSKEGKRDEYGMENIYAFDTFVAGIKAIAAYRFTNDRLTSGKYVFTQENEDNCIRDYDNLVSYLTKKYGEPAKVNKDYNATDTEKRIYSDGELIRNGKLEMSTYWFTPFTTIAITLNGERYSVSMGLELLMVLELNTRAKSLLLGEFPLAEKDLSKENGKWILRTVIHSLEGAGRFVIGLAADVKIQEKETPSGGTSSISRKSTSRNCSYGELSHDVTTIDLF